MEGSPEASTMLFFPAEHTAQVGQRIQGALRRSFEGLPSERGSIDLRGALVIAAGLSLFLCVISVGSSVSNQVTELDMQSAAAVPQQGNFIEVTAIPGVGTARNCQAVGWKPPESYTICAGRVTDKYGNPIGDNVVQRDQLLRIPLPPENQEGGDPGGNEPSSGSSGSPPENPESSADQVLTPTPDPPTPTPAPTPTNTPQVEQTTVSSEPIEIHPDIQDSTEAADKSESQGSTSPLPICWSSIFLLGGSQALGILFSIAGLVYKPCENIGSALLAPSRGILKRAGIIKENSN